MSTIKNVKINLEDGSKRDIHIEIYSTTNEVVNDCRSREVRYADYSLDEKEYKLDWHGVSSYEEALELLKLGYQPTVDKFKSGIKTNRMGSGKRISFENNVHGFAPIVPLALKGVPNSMVNMTMKPIKCKVIDVYYDMGVNSFTSADEIIKAGQKLLGTIMELEKQGYRFNLYAMQSYNRDEKTDILCVKIKNSDKPIDLKRISFPLTHPGFFRVIGFDWQGKSPVTRYLGSGRGRALTSILDDKYTKSFAEQTFGNNAVYISCNSINKKDEEHIKEVLTK